MKHYIDITDLQVGKMIYFWLLQLLLVASSNSCFCSVEKEGGNLKVLNKQMMVGTEIEELLLFKKIMKKKKIQSTEHSAGSWK